MEEMINSLNESTLFRLSLGSKELFHSNFLAWLAEKNVAFSQAIFDFLGLQDCCLKPHHIYREKENIDLWLQYKTEVKTINVFIENKVKSLPYRSQLDSYAEKQESAKKESIENHYILMSLYKPSFVDHNNCYVSKLENDKSVKWHYMSYAELADRLTNNVAIEFRDTKYYALIIDDYIKFIHELNRSSDYIRSSVNELFYLSHSNQDWKKFQDIRMGDFYEKLRYAILSERLYDKLISEKVCKNVIMGVNPGTCKDKELGKDRDAIYINTGMSRSNGLIDVKMIIDPEHATSSRTVVGIQIQDGQFRRLVETNAKDKAIDAVIKNPKIKDWFVGRDEGFDAGSKVKKQIDNEDIRYNSFKESFVYRWKKMQSCSLDELVNIIINEIKKIQNL